MKNAILLAVIDPTAIEQPALRLAESLAVDTDAAIHAFCCNYPDDFARFTSRREAKQQTLSDTRQLLHNLAVPLRAENISISTEGYWNQHWEKAVIHAATRIGASMIVKTTSPHTPLTRQLSHTSDYALLRNARCPVLLTHAGEPWQNRRILAAVALDDQDGAHDHLNNAVVAEAQKLARSTGFDLHLVTALELSPKLTDVFRLLEDDEAMESDAERIGQHFGVNPDRVHIHQGSARTVICDTAADINADVLVIGSVARKGVRAALLGNTAEQVLDNLDIDVLVIPGH